MAECEGILQWLMPRFSIRRFCLLRSIHLVVGFGFIFCAGHHGLRLAGNVHEIHGIRKVLIIGQGFIHFQLQRAYTMATLRGRFTQDLCDNLNVLRSHCAQSALEYQALSVKKRVLFLVPLHGRAHRSSGSLNSQIIYG